MNGGTSLRGRPLRFLLLVLGLWGGARMIVVSRDVAQAFAENRRADAVDEIAAVPVADGSRAAVASPAHAAFRSWPGTATFAAARLVVPIPRASAPAIKAEPAGFSVPAPDPAPEIAPTRIAAPSPLPVAPRTPPDTRVRGSFWLLWRESGQGSTLAKAGQLGGSQAGVRVDVPLGRRAGQVIEGYGRVSAAIDRPHAAEAAVGVAWRAVEGKTPVTLGIERRIALGTGGRNALALVGVSGFGPTPIARDIDIEGYGQAGFVGLRSRNGFGDGRITISHTLARSGLSLGISASGGFQPGVRRIDIGPRADMRLPLGTMRPRLSVEWRERVGGNARPGSGLAVTLGSDF